MTQLLKPSREDRSLVPWIALLFTLIAAAAGYGGLRQQVSELSRRQDVLEQKILPKVEDTNERAIRIEEQLKAHVGK